LMLEVVTPFVTAMTFPFKTFRALSFMGFSLFEVVC
jgi:hypothetical protein